MCVDTPHNQIPSSIVGMPGHPIEDVLIENMTVRFPGGGDREKVEIKLDELDSVPGNDYHYPEFSMWGELPAWGAYIRHANNVTLRNVKFIVAKEDFRPCIVADNAPGLLLKSLEVSEKGGEPVVVIKDSPKAKVVKLKVPEGTKEEVRYIPAQ
jgi:hypothetical protein